MSCATYPGATARFSHMPPKVPHEWTAPQSDDGRYEDDEGYKIRHQDGQFVVL